LEKLRIENEEWRIRKFGPKIANFLGTESVWQNTCNHSKTGQITNTPITNKLITNFERTA